MLSTNEQKQLKSHRAYNLLVGSIEEADYVVSQFADLQGWSARNSEGNYIEADTLKQMLDYMLTLDNAWTFYNPKLR
jgi:hypothetical protein